MHRNPRKQRHLMKSGQHGFSASHGSINVVSELKIACTSCCRNGCVFKREARGVRVVSRSQCYIGPLFELTVLL